jgi:hypothetical protein
MVAQVCNSTIQEDQEFEASQGSIMRPFLKKKKKKKRAEKGWHCGSSGRKPA